MAYSSRIRKGVAHFLGGVRAVSTESLGVGAPLSVRVYEVGPRDGQWYAVEQRPYILVLGQASDSALRVDPQAGRVDAQWQ